MTDTCVLHECVNGLKNFFHSFFSLILKVPEEMGLIAIAARQTQGKGQRLSISIPLKSSITCKPVRHLLMCVCVCQVGGEMCG